MKTRMAAAESLLATVADRTRDKASEPIDMVVKPNLAE